MMNFFTQISRFRLENFLIPAKITGDGALCWRRCKGRGETVMVSPLQQKFRAKGPVVITANRLSDGAVVHRTETGRWTERLPEAQILWSTAEAQLALKAAQSDGLAAVGAYAAPIDASHDAARPANLREVIRAGGPTFSLPSDAPEKVAA